MNRRPHLLHLQCCMVNTEEPTHLSKRGGHLVTVVVDGPFARVVASHGLTSVPLSPLDRIV